jgi:DNA-binding response OmpR family regulator
MVAILVIDDEKVIGSMITAALTNIGFHVETASDGMEGIEKFEKNNFDMVITDFGMPGIDGNGVARHIRNSTKKKTPVVGLSGTPWLLKNSDFDAILQKPTPIKTLVDTVKSIAQPI